MDFNTIGGDKNSHALAAYILENKRFKKHCLRRINTYNRLMRSVTNSDMTFKDKFSLMSVLFERAVDDLNRWRLSNYDHEVQDFPFAVKHYFYLVITYFKVRLEAYRIEADLTAQIKEFYQTLGIIN